MMPSVPHTALARQRRDVEQVSKLFDVYLYSGCQTLPDLMDLAARAPAIADPRVRERILNVPAPDQTHGPAPLWLDLPEDLAVALLDRLFQAGHGANGEVAPNSYRTPKYSLQSATKLVPALTLMGFGLSAGGYRIASVACQGQSARWYAYEVRITVVRGLLGSIARTSARPTLDAFTRICCVDKVTGLLVDERDYQKIMSDSRLRRQRRDG